jgi:hypothetical protein
MTALHPSDSSNKVVKMTSPQKLHIWSQTAIFEPGYTPTQDPQEGPVEPSTGLLEAFQEGTPDLPWEEEENNTPKMYYMDGSVIDEESVHYPDICIMLEHLRSI